MVGLEILPIAKLNHNRTEGLPTDGKEGRREGKHFFFFFFCAQICKQERANAGTYTVVRSFNRAMKMIAY